MAFHFQPKADSSDDDAVDLSAWKNGNTSATKKAAAKASPLPSRSPRLSATRDHAVITDSEEPNEISWSKPKPRGRPRASAPKKTPTPQPVSRPTSGFTSINRTTSHARSEDHSEEASFASLPATPAPHEREAPTQAVRVVVNEELEDLHITDFTAGGDVVKHIIEQVGGQYVVEFEDYSTETISRSRLLNFDNGAEALEQFQQEDSGSSSNKMARRSGRNSVRQRDGFVNTVDVISGDEAASDDQHTSRRMRGRGKADNFQPMDIDDDDDVEEEDEEASEEELRPFRGRCTRKPQTQPPKRSLRTSARQKNLSEELEESEAETESDSDEDLLKSDLLPSTRKRKSRSQGRNRGSDKFQKMAAVGSRQSERASRHQGGMQEVDVNDIYRDDSDPEARVPTKPKPTSTKEVFKPLPRNDEFRMRHIQECEVCGQGSSVFPLIYCQGCVLAYHKGCLGFRGTREHLATKIGHEDFVLQCRRCIGVPKKKEATAPDHGQCSDCGQHGIACRPFRTRKTTAQEMKEREDNDGEDPIYDVHESRVNRVENVLFRCLGCWRGFHFEHLPSRSDIMDLDPEVDAEQRFREYSRDWKCRECLNHTVKVSGIVAWKPIDEDNYDPGLTVEQIPESEKAYLVKWEGMSYFRASWMPGAWVWGTTTHMMRKAFAKREDSRHPKLRTEDAIPEDFLRADIVLDIKYTSIVDIQTLEVDKARIREIDKALIKYKGLGYEDAVWEAPPSPEDGDRWADFVTAYNDWVLGRYVRPPRASLKNKLEKARKDGDFSKHEKESQPANMDGGQLMNYQMQGLNWLYYKWFTNSNAILADEMGLGKTIQIIGFLATLVADWNCYPFLIVVPNSTCPNWRREIKRWAPSLRVVAFYGSKESRDLAYKYELFPHGSKELRCHVVVTSYDAAADDSCRKFFRSVPWQGLVVDEGQRLKNDKNLLYSALSSLKVPFKILLTGTPLQNNQRELFNLLQFIDDNFDAASLEAEYEELDQTKIEALHEMIRPFFLRRTKAQVLSFLPPMAQIILPLSMTLLQKKVYRSILAKNPELMKAIFSADGTFKSSERGSLSNILMQLRKCLCHPFVYSKGIEERNVSYSASHRNLVDASSKLALLELLLPKLQERGHRVLIFSQFLDMLDIVEDFLEGMQMRYQRLDGSISALQKQKRIDEFNDPESPLFAFLLSTRAGGVGINLATADTVIILDPDFNPHQDIQALSRAHRIGQTKKVLCFQFVTRASAEERIMQIGRKKLALDHVLIQEMDADDADQNDLASILRHGASELFEDSGDQDISYDLASVERLLDRSHMEDTRSGTDKSAETQFSHARVWANDSAALRDADAELGQEEQAPDPGVWANILKERERVAAEEAAARAEEFGRGRRARTNVDYAGDKAPDGVDGMDVTPIKIRKPKNSDESDTDFQANDSDDDDDDVNGEHAAPDDMDLDVGKSANANGEAGRKKSIPNFRRATVHQPENGLHTPPSDGPQAGDHGAGIQDRPPDSVSCLACRGRHAVGSCPVKLAGVEYCNLCGMAHFGYGRVCPHIRSETQVRLMQEALKHSNEPEHVVLAAKKYLQGLKGNLVQMKKQAQEKKRLQREQEQWEQAAGPPPPGWR